MVVVTEPGRRGQRTDLLKGPEGRGKGRRVEWGAVGLGTRCTPDSLKRFRGGLERQRTEVGKRVHRRRRVLGERANRKMLREEVSVRCITPRVMFTFTPGGASLSSFTHDYFHDLYFEKGKKVGERVG